MSNLLQNEHFIELLITLIGILLTILKSTELYKKHVKERYEKALACLEVGIKETQDIYVEAIKKAREDGKLTDEEKLEAKNKAIEHAKELGAKLGIDVITILGQEFLDTIIAKKVNEIK